MFSRIAILAVFLTMTILAAAAPWDTPTTTPPVIKTVTVTAPPTTTMVATSQCDTGDFQCCNSVQASSSSLISGLLGLLGIVLTDVTVLVGINCTPISVIGGGDSCTTQPVCCENNSFGGFIAIECTPINLNL